MPVWTIDDAGDRQSSMSTLRLRCDYMIGNPWHDVSPGDQTPDYVNAIIEIPKGSKAKYELDKESGLLKLDRVLFSAVHYPANYGFIPRTYADDEDPLDILVICSVDVDPLSIIEARVIGVMHMLDEDQQDDKIVAVARNDMSVNHIEDLSGLPPHTVVELRRFFEDYKKLEHKNVIVEQFFGKQRATEIVRESLVQYQARYVAKVESATPGEGSRK